MKYALATLSVIPVRKEPTEQSEMVTQILFGELFTITEKQKKWHKVKLTFDGYEGWIDEKMSHEISADEYEKIDNHKPFISTEAVNKIVRIKNSPQQIVAGSSIPFFNEQDKSFIIEDDKCVFSGLYSIVEHNEIRSSIIFQANKYINAPYLWGGRTPFGIDCSGLTQIIYKIHGIKLLRDASQQCTQGIKLINKSEWKPGDLAFFENESNKIVHVGILANENHIIHASGFVRIDTIDETGILCRETGCYTHKLSQVRTLLIS